MITSLGYERGYLEWGIAYTFPWKNQSKLRFNLNSPSFKNERKHWRFYIGDISHEELDIQIWRATHSKKAWEGWHKIQFGTLSKVPKRIPISSALSYNGFLSEYALNAVERRYRRTYKH